MGQENAESAGTRQLSGIGGQMDFLEGAYRSVGGKGIHLQSTLREKTKDGTLKVQHRPRSFRAAPLSPHRVP